MNHGAGKIEITGLIELKESLQNLKDDLSLLSMSQSAMNDPTDEAAKVLAQKFADHLDKQVVLTFEGKNPVEHMLYALKHNTHGPSLYCVGCGSFNTHRLLKYEVPGEPTEYDLECTQCGSTEFAEGAAELTKKLVDQRDTFMRRYEWVRKIMMWVGEPPESTVGVVNKLATSVTTVLFDHLLDAQLKKEILK